MIRVETAAPMIAGLILGVTSVAAAAQDYPSRPVTLVVPYAPGGVVDVVGRLVGDKLTTSFGTRVIVDNRAGAGGTIGAAAVARAKPDGYTLLMGGAATHAFAPSLYTSLPYDPVKSFTPVAQLTSGPLVLVVHPSIPAQDLKQFLAFLRTHGDRVNYASNASGTFPHLSVELMKRSSGLKATHVPYNGGPKAILAVVEGEVSFSINHIPNAQGLIAAGRLRALATTGLERSSVFRDLPTLNESGFKGFEANAWFGLFAPAGTARPIVEKVGAQASEAVKSKEVREKLAAQGDEPVGSSPAAFATYLQSELGKWPKVIRDAGVKIE